jgi:FtsP/CotA-like multicopper oxidase with cupredoxin domain
MSRFSLGFVYRLLALLITTTLCAVRINAQAEVIANQNHTSAGILRDGTLTIQLEIAKGEWHPEADDGMSVSVYAFGEAGHPLQNPGPLIRVPQGTHVQASLHNTLSVPIDVHGLGEPGSADPVAHVAPQESAQVRFTASTPGLFFYWGASDGNTLSQRHGADAELTGAFVVDPPGADANDEIFVIEMISDRAGPGSRQTLATINGKSWPYTQRFNYELGHRARWRWINATNEPHALHLHGFYYHVDAVNHGGKVENYEGESRPWVVTQRVAQGDTYDMSWSPDRPGRWLFHCHMLVHMNPPILPLLPDLQVHPASATSTPHSAMNDATGMGQLVLGITVPDPGNSSGKETWHANRKLQLEINEREVTPHFTLQIRDGKDSAKIPDPAGLIGPPIILTRGEPVEIEIINQTRTPTAIHWHGIELESYYDGVPGWTGGSQTTPPVQPGESFVAHITPPRAGTFIYHTHWHDGAQLLNGLYGPLIVLPPGEKFDPVSDRIFLFSLGDFGALREIGLINGSPQSKTLQLEAGRKYRFRFINITTNNQALQVSLRDPNGPVDWRIVAKDGADLPASQLRSAKAQLTVSVGETYDVEFTSSRPQDVLLDLLMPAQKIHISQTLVFAAPAPAKTTE